MSSDPAVDIFATRIRFTRVCTRIFTRSTFIAMFLTLVSATFAYVHAGQRPNIVLVMADDQGWGQTGYYNHPVLKTPNLDAMAENGLRFDRFYAGGPVCSPTRATVLTGRTHVRAGVESHGFPLRAEEKTIAQALRKAGYATGHFGKWHLNGLRGPGVPILKDDMRHPGVFGFETWLSVTNFFDRDPIMSRNGDFEEFQGDSSEIIVDEALKFIATQVDANKPFFTVIWYGTPHSPFVAAEDDKSAFQELDAASQNHYGELVAMDRSIGALRAGLRELKVADDTLFWFTSDNGGLPNITPGTVGGLRGFKGSLYEGGLRVPGIIEWPAGIKEPRITKYPAGAMDIFPTLADIVGLPGDSMVQPQDGVSLRALLSKDITDRKKPIGFRYASGLAMVDNQYKIVVKGRKTELFDLDADTKEATNLSAEKPDVLRKMQRQLDAWNRSVENSVNGSDYPNGTIEPQPKRRFWTDEPDYEKYFSTWKKRPEYQGRLKRYSPQ